MAFTAGKERFARASDARYAADVLAAYLQGRERAYAVHDALGELEALFGAGAVLPCRLIREGMKLPLDDEEGKAALFTKAIDMIELQTRTDEEGA